MVWIKKRFWPLEIFPKVATIQFKDLNCLDALLAKNIIITEKCLEDVKKLLIKEQHDS